MNGLHWQEKVRNLGRISLLGAFVLAAAVSSGCEEPPDLTLPGVSEVESAYDYGGAFSATLNGNVAEITIVQASRHIERGGTLWVKVGPYVFLFSQETMDLFRDYPGLAGVRAITKTPLRFGKIGRSRVSTLTGAPPLTRAIGQVDRGHSMHLTKPLQRQ